MKQKDQQKYPQQNYEELPQQNDNRKCTDVFCLLFGLAFSLVILVIAIVLFKKSTFYSLTLPTDSSGNICGQDLPNYPYVLFLSPPLISSRVCVSSCPTTGQTLAICQPNTVVTSCAIPPTMNTYAQQTAYGDFCWPTDPVTTEALQRAGQLLPRMQFIASTNGIRTSLLVVLVISIIYLILVQCATCCMNYTVLPLSIGFLIFGMVLVGNFSTSQSSVLVGTSKSTQQSVKKGILAGLIAAAVAIVISFFRNLYSIKLNYILLKAAGRVACWRKSIFLFIPLFLVMLVGCVGMVLFEFLGYWSNGRKIFLPAEYLYYQIHGFSFSTGVLILLIIQLLWGMSFVKQSFNFCLSGNAISWYFEEVLGQKKGTCCSLFVIFWRHFGSIIACSFTTCFFSIFDYIFDMVRPATPEDCHSSCFNCLCGWFHYLGDLVRTDSLSIVGVVGYDFWKSSPRCENLSKRTPSADFYQFQSRLFSFCSHFFIGSLSILVGIYIGKVESIEALGVVLVGSFLISTCFITFHLDLAQTIEIMYLLDQQYMTSVKQESARDCEKGEVSKYRTDLAIEIQELEAKQNQK